MKQLNKEKMKVIKFCRVTLREEELEAESKSINLIRAFTGLRKHQMNDLESLGENQAMELDDYQQNLTEAVSTLEDNLMEIEMLLQDALQESTGKFRDRVVGLIASMKNKTMDYIKFVIEQADTFHTSLKNYALIEQASFEAEISKDEFVMPDNDPEFDAKLEILGEKDPCIQMLDTFKEYMDNQLGDIERKINKSITEEWDKIDKSITTD
jgi:hypothetical protein